MCCDTLFRFHSGLFKHFTTFATGADFSVAFAIVLSDEVDRFFAVDETVFTEWTDVNFLLKHPIMSQKKL